MTHAPVTRRTVGSWEIQDVIGSGSFAIVWKARHVATGVLSAVKEILADRLNKKLQESLESEIAVLQKLKHNNIVGLLDLYKEPGKIFLVLEYCGGGDLSQHLRQRGPLSEASCRYLLRQLAEGLKVLRQHNVIHRDLKPQNLLLSDNGPSPTLKIADFGFARSLQPAGLAETLCGSPLYMAPEVLQLHRYDAKADLWSVGTILFELLAGKPPFSGANHYQLVQNIERGDATLPEHIARRLSAGCRQLLHQLLRRNPVERISFDEFFAHPFLIGEAASAAVTPLPGAAPLQDGSQPLLPASASPSAAAAAANAAAWAASPPGAGPGGVSRRYTPSSQGAVRFVQPVRCGSPVHPAFQVPPGPSASSPPAGEQPPTQQQQQQQQLLHQHSSPDGLPQRQQHASGPGGSAAAAGELAGPAAATATGAPGGQPAPTATAAAAIHVRELTRSPSPRIVAAAAAVASSLMMDGTTPPAPGQHFVPASAGTAAVMQRPSSSPTQQQQSSPAAQAASHTSGGVVSLDGGGPGALSGCSSTGAGGRPLVDSLDSDYVVVSSPSAAGVARQTSALPMSPRTPHPAMATPTKGPSRSGSAGGAPPQPLAAGSRPASNSAGGAVASGLPGAPASPPAPAAPSPSWQQLLPPIAAATLPSGHNHGLPYTLTAATAAAGLGVMGPQPAPVSTATAATPGPAPVLCGVSASASATTVTIRVPPPGGCDPDNTDPLLVPRVVGVLLDHARHRCGALLDTEAEARQLMGAALGGAPGDGGTGPSCGAGTGRAELADEAAGAVGTLLVACRLLVAMMCGSPGAGGGAGGGGGGGGGGGSRGCGGSSGGAEAHPGCGEALRSAQEVAGGADGGAAAPEEAPAPPASPQRPPAEAAPPAARSPSSPSPAALAALASHARSMLATLDEHMHGSVAQLLLDGADEPRAAPPAAPAPAPTTAPTVPCVLDSLLAVAVHHSRAGAGEELLGNAAGAAEHYGRAADLLLFLLEAPPQQQQQQQQRMGQQQQQHPGQQPGDPAQGSGGSSSELDSVRPALTPPDRQRLTRYYAAVRLRESAALAAAGGPPTPLAPGGPYHHQQQHHHHPYQQHYPYQAPHILAGVDLPQQRNHQRPHHQPHHHHHNQQRDYAPAAGPRQQQPDHPLDSGRLVMAALSPQVPLPAGPVSLAAGPPSAAAAVTVTVPGGGMPYGYEQPKGYGAVVF